MGQITEESLKLAGALTFPVTEPDAVAATVESAARIAFSGGFSAAVLLSQRLLGTKLFKD
jgi:hypothetical protein